MCTCSPDARWAGPRADAPECSPAAAPAIPRTIPAFVRDVGTISVFAVYSRRPHRHRSRPPFSRGRLTDLLDNSTTSSLFIVSNPIVQSHNSPVYRFAVGDFECAALAANTWEIPSPHPFFAPQATAEQFAAALAKESLPASPIRLYFNVLLIRNGHQNILIDAGFAKNSVPAVFDVASNLSALGLTPSDIDVVILSHAHGDHMGGLLDESGKQVFARAQHFCSAEEIAFWTGPTPDFSESRLDEKSRASSIAAARRIFESISFTRITPSTVLPDGLTAFLAPGHTPGHMNFRIRSGSEILHHMMDLAHHFALMPPHPDWTVAFDVNSKLAAATRREIFPRLAAEGVRVFGYHVPFPGLGHIQVSGDAFRWVPELWNAHL